jgi:hypothetical protein
MGLVGREEQAKPFQDQPLALKAETERLTGVLENPKKIAV